MDYRKLPPAQADAFDAVRRFENYAGDQQQVYIETLASAVLGVMRIYGGDEYVREWFQWALKELEMPLVTEGVQ